jgi:hypothetical protein
VEAEMEDVTTSWSRFEGKARISIASIPT